MALDQEILLRKEGGEKDPISAIRRLFILAGCFDIRYCRFANASCISPPTDQKSLKLVLNDRYHFPLADGIPRKSTTDREIDN